jgi:uncharacterized protein YjbJ (UPF0337 family)
MSESFGGGQTVTPGGASPQSSGTADAAKSEAKEVAGTAAQEAGHVVDTAKSEAGAVASEAKAQVKDLYAQTQGELKEQAAAQQKRVAEGLTTIGDELKSMANGAENPGVAADIVQQVSARVSGAASWIGDRDPGSLLQEVKSYARRKPGTFIAVAAIAGLAVGRLTRALAESAKDEHDSASPQSAPVGGGVITGVPPVPPVPAELGTPTPGSTPVYDQSRAAWDDVVTGDGSSDVRRDTL